MEAPAVSGGEWGSAHRLQHRWRAYPGSALSVWPPEEDDQCAVGWDAQPVSSLLFPCGYHILSASHQIGAQTITPLSFVFRDFNLKEALEGVSTQICCELNKSLTERNYPALTPALQATLTGQICGITERDNPIRTLVGKTEWAGVIVWLESFLQFNCKRNTLVLCLSRIENTNYFFTQNGDDSEARNLPIWNFLTSYHSLNFCAEDRVQQYFMALICDPKPQAKLEQVPAGLTAIKPELAFMGAKFISLVNYNKTVYGPFYADIMRKLMFSSSPPAENPPQNVAQHSVTSN